jgi:hypothetical protein
LGLQQTLNLTCAKIEKATQVKNKKRTISSYTRNSEEEEEEDNYEDAFTLHKLLDL